MAGDACWPMLLRWRSYRTKRAAINEVIYRQKVGPLWRNSTDGGQVGSRLTHLRFHRRKAAVEGSLPETSRSPEVVRPSVACQNSQSFNQQSICLGKSVTDATKWRLSHRFLSHLSRANQKKVAQQVCRIFAILANTKRTTR